MKKLSVLLACLVSFSFAAFAEKSSAKEIFTNFGSPLKEKGGNIIVNVGAGVDTGILSPLTWSFYIPPVAVSGEYTVKCGPVPLGFGLEAGFSMHRNIFYISDEYGKYRCTEYFNDIFADVIINYHINLPVKNLDVYAGPRAGVNLYLKNIEQEVRNPNTGSRSVEKSTGLVPEIRYGGVIGATWYFSNLLGANVELGYPIFAKASVSFKF